MPDPLSVAAGVAGLISFGIQVTMSLMKFYTTCKSQDADVTRTTENLKNILGTFEFLLSGLQSRTFRPDEDALMKSIESYTTKCDESIQELQEEYAKFSEISSAGGIAAIRAGGRRATYPFRKSTLQKLEEDLSEIRHNLMLALDVLQLKDGKAIQDDIGEVKSLVEAVKVNQVTTQIHDWLKAPDATVDHKIACAKRHPGTGNCTPPVASLMDAFRAMVLEYEQMYILLEALDESPRYSQRPQVLDTIETMRNWRIPGLHFLVTSRDEPDIREALDPTKEEDIPMNNDKIKTDIGNFISGNVKTDRKLQKWSMYHDQIQQALAEGAQGVYVIDGSTMLGLVKHYLTKNTDFVGLNVNSSRSNDARGVKVILTTVCGRYHEA
ncbi:hypothetical protein MMC25_001459 [Agyrium rufum]|nr:hypothetical protein [Agyrium rufum]